MTDVIDRLVVAMNKHDLDGAGNLFHEDYRSEQPAHPGRALSGERRCAPTGRPSLPGSLSSGPSLFGRLQTMTRRGVNGAGQVAVATGSPSRPAG